MGGYFAGAAGLGAGALGSVVAAPSAEATVPVTGWPLRSGGCDGDEESAPGVAAAVAPAGAA